MKVVFLPALAISFLSLSACNVGPAYQRPRADTPTSFRGPDEAPVSSTDQESLGDRQWSAVFHQPELQELIRSALVQNYDLRIAAQRILEQEAQVRITRAQQFPTLNVGGTGAGAELLLPSVRRLAVRSPSAASIFRRRGHPISGASTTSRPKPPVTSCLPRHGRSAPCA